jgi:tRNA dimethylallyltransferase
MADTNNPSLADTKPVLVIVGPTASGKSKLALAAADALNGVVINADSMQVYQQLRILTARPTLEDEAQAPHKLYGWLDPFDVCSAGRWREAALAEIEAAHDAGQRPIIVGGTGFYIEALMHGLPDAPDIPAAVREAARADVMADPRAVHAALAVADPITAKRISMTDSQRLARALEVWRATGLPPSTVLQSRSKPPPGLHFHVIAVTPERSALYARINARVEEMVMEGVVDEAVAFTALKLDPGLPAAKAVGLREFAAFASGVILLPEAISQTAQASRRYAKRQLTWLHGRVQAGQTLHEQLNYNNIYKIARNIS